MYKVIFDADGIVYRVGWALENVDSLRIVEIRVQEYIDFHMTQITKLFGKIEKTPIIALSAAGQGNFRFARATILPYKGNRTAPKPKHYTYIRSILSKYDGFVQKEGQEADDTIADIASENPEMTVVVSQDKDLLQNPGWYYIPGGEYTDLCEDEDGNVEYTNVQCTKRPVFYVDKNDTGMLQLEMATGKKKVLFGYGEVWHYAQMLLGDAADNIPGIPGFGPVKVYMTYLDFLSEQKLYGKGNLDSFGSYVKQIYKEYYKDEWKPMFDEVYELLKIGGHQHAG